MSKESFAIVDLVFQDRERGYDHGFRIDLSKLEAVELIDYLKSFKHWYSESEPSDGVELFETHCWYIEKHILKREILDFYKYEIIVGSLGERDFHIFEIERSKALVIAAFFKDEDRLAHNTLITSYFANHISKSGLDWSSGRRKLSKDEFLKILQLNREIGGAPIEMDADKYDFSLQVQPMFQFMVNCSLLHGISDRKHST